MMQMDSKIEVAALGKVAVLLGGTSAEREVSLMSGGGVLNALRARGVDAHAFDPAQADLGQLKAHGYARCFIALHGRHGEDGTVQGALELLGIPYTGPGVMASAIAMDKIMTKRLWRAQGLPTPDWRLVASADQTARAFQELGAPMIVKPSREGSTLGLTRVTSIGQCEQAYHLAARFDPEVLCEQFIDGDETTCPVLGACRTWSVESVLEERRSQNRPQRDQFLPDLPPNSRAIGQKDGVLEERRSQKRAAAVDLQPTISKSDRLLGQEQAAQALPLIRIVAPEGNYDYQNKYFTDATQYHCPSGLPEQEEQRIQELVVQAYRSLGCRGWARADIMIRASDRQPFLLEINTSPGMTGHSLVPMSARAAGISYEDLCLHILASASLDAWQGRSRTGEPLP